MKNFLQVFRLRSINNKSDSKIPKDKVGLAKPDGRIDVGGNTWNTLIKGSFGSNTEAVKVVIVIPTSLEANFFPCFN